jgi:hypothetical protein
MYSPRQQRRKQIICYFLQRLYPKAYPEEQITRVIRRINQCSCHYQLLKVLISEDYVRDERLDLAFHQKLQELRPGNKPMPYKRRQALEPLLSCERALYITLIKSLGQSVVGKEPASLELYNYICTCTTKLQLADVIHTSPLSIIQPIDSIEKRYQALP